MNRQTHINRMANQCYMPAIDEPLRFRSQPSLDAMFDFLFIGQDSQPIDPKDRIEYLCAWELERADCAHAVKL